MCSGTQQQGLFELSNTEWVHSIQLEKQREKEGEGVDLLEEQRLKKKNSYHVGEGSEFKIVMFAFLFFFFPISGLFLSR